MVTGSNTRDPYNQASSLTTMEWVSLVNVARSEHVRGTYGVGHYEVTTDYTDDQFTLTIDRCHFEQE